jgi:hypothetical protein
MAHIGRQFDTPEDEESGALAKRLDLRWWPERVVLGEADAVEAAFACEVNQFFRSEGAALGEWQSVAVQIDEH